MKPAHGFSRAHIPTLELQVAFPRQFQSLCVRDPTLLTVPPDSLTAIRVDIRTFPPPPPPSDDHVHVHIHDVRHHHGVVVQIIIIVVVVVVVVVVVGVDDVHDQLHAEDDGGEHSQDAHQSLVLLGAAKVGAAGC